MNAKETARKLMRQYGHQPAAFTREGKSDLYIGKCKRNGCKLGVKIDTGNLFRIANTTVVATTYFNTQQPVKAQVNNTPFDCTAKKAQS